MGLIVFAPDDARTRAKSDLRRTIAVTRLWLSLRGAWDSSFGEGVERNSHRQDGSENCAGHVAASDQASRPSIELGGFGSAKPRVSRGRGTDDVSQHDAPESALARNRG